MDETAMALNRLAREQMKCRLLQDIRVDLAVCEIEGWSQTEYIDELMTEVKGLAEVKRAYDNARGAVPNESKQAIF